MAGFDAGSLVAVEYWEDWGCWLGPGDVGR